uniref:Uncharacterized protein n=1 Tax=Anopheles dirus TaxID=7168 RepID=A0A182NCI0_9DIPT
MAMTSPTVPMQQKSNSRISNFSVASLLADTRPKTPTAPHHAIITSGTATNTTPTTPTPTLTPLSPLMHGTALHGALHQTALPGASPSGDLHCQPANLSSSHTTSSCSPRSQHDGSSLRNADPDRADTPHSLLESDDYDSNHDEEEDSIVDIEDMDHELSEGGSQPSGRKGSGSPGSPSTLGLPHGSPPSLAGHVPIRPTPFSALAAAAAAWGGMSGGVPWPGARQMPPFGPPGLFPGQGFGAGQLGGDQTQRYLCNAAHRTSEAKETERMSRREG